MESAGPWGSFRRVTLVYLTPATFFVFIISIINAFKVFRETYLLAGEYPHPSIYMLQHYMNNTFRNLDYQKLPPRPSSRLPSCADRGPWRR